MQREALFNKSERQVAESQLATVQQQLAELKAKSSHIQELHRDMQESQGLVKEKDRKVRVQFWPDHDSCSQWTARLDGLMSVCCADNRVVQRSFPAEGGTRGSYTSFGHNVFRLCSS